MFSRFFLTDMYCLFRSQPKSMVFTPEDENSCWKILVPNAKISFPRWENTKNHAESWHFCTHILPLPKDTYIAYPNPSRKFTFFTAGNRAFAPLKTNFYNVGSSFPKREKNANSPNKLDFCTHLLPLFPAICIADFNPPIRNNHFLRLRTKFPPKNAILQCRSSSFQRQKTLPHTEKMFFCTHRFCRVFLPDISPIPIPTKMNVFHNREFHALSKSPLSRAESPFSRWETTQTHEKTDFLRTHFATFFCQMYRRYPNFYQNWTFSRQRKELSPPKACSFDAKSSLSEWWK